MSKGSISGFDLAYSRVLLQGGKEGGWMDDNLGEKRVSHAVLCG